jgi:hypothetical protein
MRFLVIQKPTHIPAIKVNPVKNTIAMINTSSDVANQLGKLLIHASIVSMCYAPTGTTVTIKLGIATLAIVFPAATATSSIDVSELAQASS